MPRRPPISASFLAASAMSLAAASRLKTAELLGRDSGMSTHEQYGPIARAAEIFAERSRAFRFFRSAAVACTRGVPVSLSHIEAAERVRFSAAQQATLAVQI